LINEYRCGHRRTTLFAPTNHVDAARLAKPVADAMAGRLHRRPMRFIDSDECEFDTVRAMIAEGQRQKIACEVGNSARRRAQPTGRIFSSVWILASCRLSTPRFQYARSARS